MFKKSIILRLMTFVAVLCAVWANPNHAQAATFTVSKLADTSDGTCNADCSLRDAIITAKETAGADTIAFMAGVRGAINLKGALPALDDEMTIAGPGANFLTVRRDTGGDYRIFLIAEQAKVTIKDVTISNGRSAGPESEGQGGGIYNGGGQLVLRGCKVTGNSAGLNDDHSSYVGDGGGIYNAGGNVEIYGSLIADNSVFGSGGGIYNAGNLIVVSSIFLRNSTSYEVGFGYERGGAIYNDAPYGQKAQLSRCTFTGNVARNGGALHSNGESTSGFSTFSDNRAYANGGAISLDNFAQLLLENSTLHQNEANFGGGIFNNLGSFDLRNSTLSANVATTQGGGICTGNYGRILNCTITRNTAPQTKGGGIFLDDFGAYISVRNSIVSGNSFSDVDYAVGTAENTFSSDGYNLIGIGNGLDAFHQFGDRIYITEPGLDDLADNGGPTKTHLPQIGSPAIDAGTFIFSHDQTGQTRPLNGNSDIGAVEFDAFLSINSLRVKEYDSGTQQANFTVSLMVPRSLPVRVRYSTRDVSANAPADYLATGGIITFEPGQTRKVISLTVKGDALDERDESFQVSLYGAENALIAIADARGFLTILDDDRTPTVSISDAMVREGNGGETFAIFRLTLSAPSGRYIFLSGSDFPATAQASRDYLEQPPLAIEFEPGQTSTTFGVQIMGDLLNEANETFYIVLSGPQNVIIGRGRALGTIIDDDAAPALSINDVSISEGPAQGAPAGTKNLTFTVSLSKASGQSISVNYATADGIARSTSDYVAKSGTLSFAPGSALTRTISITINGDTLIEGDETLYIILSGPVNASIGRGRGARTIINDDSSG
ncbi:MAG TPA: Calx-beta domain-containing protein [Abditibacteriaceae bacterium]|jgi:CSLREA domain-containing protein